MSSRSIRKSLVAEAIVQCSYAKIPAIKAYRSITGDDLRTAKTAIEAVHDYEGILAGNQDAAASYVRSRPIRFNSASNR